jgi:polyhydroxyalkanoate synthesis regulator phasin
MAKYKTSAEAIAELSQQLKEKKTLLKGVEGTTDVVLKKNADRLKSEIAKLENQLRIETLSAQGPIGKLGVAGAGLLAGIPRGVTTMIDLAAQGGAKLESLFPTLAKSQVVSSAQMRPDYLLTPKVLPGVESTSAESAPAFGLGEGAGMSAIGGPKQMVIGGLTRSADETFFDGVPFTQLSTAAFQIGAALRGGVRNWNQNKQVKKILDSLGPDGEKAFNKFMAASQSSSDPVVAGEFARIRQNPQFAELFNVLERSYADATIKATRPTTAKGYDPEKTGSAVFQAFEGQILKLREDIMGKAAPKFDAALKMGGNNNIIMTDNTVRQLNGLIDEFSAAVGKTGAGTTDATASLKFVTSLRDDLAAGRISPERMKALLSEFGSKAKKGESLIENVSSDSQKRIASAIFGGLSDDLKMTAQTSTVPRIRETAKRLEDARQTVKQGYDALETFTAQGLPKVISEMNIKQVDTDTLLKTIKGLTPAQKDKMAAVLQDTAPEDLKRIKQVMFDDYVQGARTLLPDGMPGVDLKVLSTKFNNAPEIVKKDMAFALGTNYDDFSKRMKDAQDFFKYQQRYAGVKGGPILDTAAVDAASSAAAVGLGYAPAKAVSLGGRAINLLGGGLSDEQTIRLLTSPETRTLLKEARLSPAGVKTLQKIEESLFVPSTPVQSLSSASQIGIRTTAPREQPMLNPFEAIGADESMMPSEAPAAVGSQEPEPINPFEAIGAAD